ncbi:tetratricopeptide repeat protein [Nonomuraea sp. NPDC051191]|uniref:tetratricopeptide repeat protein n=1 Tax=Nonomuraea sp. NPDC051191 TaxID=3364372 RepID=UPI0037B4E07C
MSVIGSQIALAGLGMVPGVGSFTSMLDPNQVAAGADRFKALVSARFHSQEDADLILTPLQILTPAFLQGVADAAERRPWVVLFFDTYERTAPVLDLWLRDILFYDRYGRMPANVLIVLAGQSRLNPQCWGDWLDLVTDLPLDVFTETEAHQFIASRGISDEKITEVILDLSGRLPVLVSTLSEARPSSVAEIGDPSGTAVERFLKWETNPVRRAAAMACALPQELDEDIYRIAVEEEAEEEFGWLQSLPFFINRVDRGHYHDVVRSAMLRLQRQQSPHRWTEQQTRLADTFQELRVQLEGDIAPASDRWDDSRWRRYKLQETYHRLCADYRGALPYVLRELLDAQDHDIATLRRWVQTLARAGQDADAIDVRRWAKELSAALETSDSGITALTLLIARGGFDASGKHLAYVLRAWEHRQAGSYEQALADCNAAFRFEVTGRVLRNRGETYRLMGRYEEALVDFDRALELEPDYVWAVVSRGQTYESMGRYEEALADFDRALELKPDYAWAFRGHVLRLLARHEEALADFDRALEVEPNSCFSVSNRGVVFRVLGHYAEALADLDRAIVIDPGSGWAYYEKAVALYAMRDLGYEACAIRAIELCSSLGDDGMQEIADTGNLVLAHCLMSRWAEADRHLSAFLNRKPSRGNLMELSIVLDTLRPVIPSAEDHISSFRNRLEVALG